MIIEICIGGVQSGGFYYGMLVFYEKSIEPLFYLGLYQ